MLVRTRAGTDCVGHARAATEANPQATVLSMGWRLRPRAPDEGKNSWNSSTSRSNPSSGAITDNPRVIVDTPMACNTTFTSTLVETGSLGMHCSSVWQSTNPNPFVVRPSPTLVSAARGKSGMASAIWEEVGNPE